VLVVLAEVGVAQNQAQSVDQGSLITEKYFGMHIQRGAPWPSIPIGAWRVPVAWPWVEPQRGVWDFQRPDEYVAESSQHHNVELLFSLGYSPRWASSQPDAQTEFSGPGACAPPRNIQDWRDYIKTIGTRYKGRVRYYEVWNEPTVPFFWCGGTLDLVSLTKAAYEVLKEIDPNDQIVSPSAVNKHGPAWLDDFLRQGGGNFVDIIGFHFYPAPGSPEGVVGQAKTIRTLMAKYGQANKPLWDTENTWNGSKLDRDTDAAFVARTLILDRASGVSRVYWYEWGNMSIPLVLLEADRKTLTPAGQTFKVLQDWLIGAVLESCGSTYIPEAWHVSHAMWTCDLQRGQSTAKIVWNPDGDSTFNVPASWNIDRVRDISGKSTPLPATRRITIGIKPLLLDQSD